MVDDVRVTDDPDVVCETEELEDVEWMSDEGGGGVVVWLVEDEEGGTAASCSGT